MNQTPKQAPYAAAMCLVAQGADPMMGSGAGTPSYMTGRGEPGLEDLLSDPAMHALMSSDRVRADELRTLIRRTRRGLLSR